MIGLGFSGLTGAPNVYSVKRMGVRGDGTTDDTSAIQAVIDTAITTGGTVYFPKGFYRITGRIDIGADEWTSYSFMVDQTQAVGDDTIAASLNSSNESANNSLNSIDIVFEQGAFLVADFSPESVTPALSYNLSYSESKTRKASLINVAVISPGVYVSGALVNNNISNDTYGSDNVIGIHINNRVGRVENAFVSGLEYGIAAINPYWSTYSGCAVFHASQGYSFCQANAATISNVLARNCNKGIVFNGGASSVRDIHAQLCNQDLIILNADCCEFGPGYLEDSASLTGGSGKYSVTIGTTENGSDVVHCVFMGLRATGQRTGKEAFRVWSTRNSNFWGCRSYGANADFDTNSTGNGFGNDFTLASNFKTQANLPKWAGTVASNQVATWDSDGVVTGTNNLLYDETTLRIGGTSANNGVASLDRTVGQFHIYSNAPRTTNYYQGLIGSGENGTAINAGIAAFDDGISGALGISIFGGNNSALVEGLKVHSSGRVVFPVGAILTASAPASASDTGTTGEIRVDANYIYVCTATNTWKMTALSTW